MAFRFSGIFISSARQGAFLRLHQQLCHNAAIEHPMQPPERKTDMHTGKCFILLMLVLSAFPVHGGEKPQLPPAKHGIYVAAHRGAHKGIPENTLAAYRKAIELGCDFVEVDLRTSKDGVIVSIHNSTVDQYTEDASGPVKDFTFAELRALDIGSRIGPEWKAERIPSFAEILALCKGRIGIYLDLKSAPVEDVVALVREKNMAHAVIWYAMPQQLKKVRELCPECIVMPDPGHERLLPRLIEVFHPVVVAAVWRNFSESFVRTCHAAGAVVIVDESDPGCWEQALQWGADGIQTDHPEKLIAFLRKHQAGAEE
jgi:glycerophosphoryl diester phosphodiesterase